MFGAKTCHAVQCEEWMGGFTPFLGDLFLCLCTSGNHGQALCVWVSYMCIHSSIHPSHPILLNAISQVALSEFLQIKNNGPFGLYN